MKINNFAELEELARKRNMEDVLFEIFYLVEKQTRSKKRAEKRIILWFNEFEKYKNEKLSLSKHTLPYFLFNHFLKELNKKNKKKDS